MSAAAVSSDGPPRFFALVTLADGTLVLGTRGRGLVRSEDAGATWSPPDVPPGSAEIFGLCVLDGSRLAAATGSGVWASDDAGLTWRLLGVADTSAYCVVGHRVGLVAGTEGHGVVVSHDDGRTWTSLPVDLAANSVYRLLALDDHELLAGTEAGLRRLTLHGEAWCGTLAGLEGLPIYALARAGEETILAGTRGEGVARSADGGATWQLDGTGLPDPVVTCLHVDRADAYAGTGLGVASSDDGGRSWGAVGEGLANYRIFCLAVHPTAGLIAGSYESVWVLAPGTRAWAELDTGLVKDASSISLDVAGALFAGTSDGLLRSSDAGATWEPAADGIASVRVNRVIRLASGALVAATDTGVVRATGTTMTWQPCGLDGRRVRCVLEPAPGVVLAGTLGSGLFRSTDGGETWCPVDTGFAVPHVYDLLLTSRGRVVLASGDPSGVLKSGVVLRSDDAGSTWQCAADDPLTSYRVVESSRGTLFVGAQRCKILRSRDGGTTWTLLDTTGLNDVKLWALAVDAQDRVLLGTAKGLLISEDDAQTWTSVDEGLDGVTVYDLRAHPNGTLVAATSIGVMRSRDGGSSWA